MHADTDDLILPGFSIGRVTPKYEIQDYFDDVIKMESSQKEIITVGRFQQGRALYESMKRD